MTSAASFRTPPTRTSVDRVGVSGRMLTSRDGGVSALSGDHAVQNVFTIDDIRVELSPGRLGDYFGGGVVAHAASGAVTTTGGTLSPESVRIAAFGAVHHHHQDHRASSRPQMMVTGVTPALAALQHNMKQPFLDGVD